MATRLMSESTILGCFARSGCWHHLSRKFHNLPRDAKQQALTAIQNGVDPDKAIRKARKAK